MRGWGLLLTSVLLGRAAQPGEQGWDVKEGLEGASPVTKVMGILEAAGSSVRATSILFLDEGPVVRGFLPLKVEISKTRLDRIPCAIFCD